MIKKLRSFRAGATPLIELHYIFEKERFDMYAKLEYMNPGGSLKDRTSKAILLNALEEGKINKKTTIIESTSGNMGIGLARICKHLGLPLILVIDPFINAITIKILKVYGVDIIQVDTEDGNGGYLKSRMKKVRELIDCTPNSFNPDQYRNRISPQAHYQTVREIIDQLPKPPDYVIVPTSTCGTLMGISRAFKDYYNISPYIIAVDVKGSFIFDDKPKKRRIPGMGSSRKSDFLDMKYIDEVVLVSEDEIIKACHKLMEKESILIGGSSGAVVAAIEKIRKNVEPNRTVIGIFADSGERYLDTIFNPLWLKKNKNDLEEETLETRNHFEY